MIRTLTLGVDPGKSGAVALLADDGRLLGVADMPVVGNIISGVLLNQAVRDLLPVVLAPVVVLDAVIEDVHAMPKQGVSSSFSFGRALGVAEGVLAGQGWAITYVSPAKWKKALGLSNDKGMSRRRAIEQWPTHAHLFARVKDDGRAEAALLALWHLRNRPAVAA